MSKNKHVDNDANQRRIIFVIELFIEHLNALKHLEGFNLFKAICADFNVNVDQAWEQYKCYNNAVVEAEN